MCNKLVFIGDLYQYKDAVKGDSERHLKRLIAECERCKTIPLPKEHPPTSSTYMGIAIFNLALGYLLTKEEWMLQEARRFIKTVLNYEKWGNAHLVNLDLSASWILWGLSLGYDWLEPFLTEEEKQAISQKIKHHAKIIYDYGCTNRKGWSVNYCQNHNWINYNGIATAGYVLQKHYNVGSEYSDFALENFRKVFELMPADGSNYEGVTYWRYGGMWLFVYAHLVKERQGVDFFASSQYLKNTFYYRLYQSGGSLALQLDFGDCHDRNSCHCAAVYYKVAAEYKDGYAQSFGDIILKEHIEEEAELSKVKPGILPEAGFELLFYDSSVAPKPLTELSNTAFFEDLGLLAVRTGFGEDKRAFAFKCGAPGGALQWAGFHSGKYEGMELSLSHHHPDNMSYIFCQGRNYFTREDGYNRNILPTHHNVLLVDGLYTDVSDVNDVYTSSYYERIKTETTAQVQAEYQGSCSEVALADNFICYKAINTGIYPKKLNMTEVSRTMITTQKLDFIIFLNLLSSKDKHNYKVICNTDIMPKASEENCYVTQMGDNAATYLVHSDSDIVSSQYTQNITAVMTTQQPDKVCVVDMNTTSTKSKIPQEKQAFIEVIAMQSDCAMTIDNGLIKVTTKNETVSLLCAGDSAKYDMQSKGDFAIKINDDEWRWL